MPHGIRSTANWPDGVLVMKWPLLLLFAATGALWAGDEGRLFFSKAFPGSVPAYMQVTLDQKGNAEYREAPDDELPLKFHLTDADTQAVFDLAGKLDHFKRALESP